MLRGRVRDVAGDRSTMDSCDAHVMQVAVLPSMVILHPHPIGPRDSVPATLPTRRVTAPVDMRHNSRSVLVRTRTESLPCQPTTTLPLLARSSTFVTVPLPSSTTTTKS